MPDINSLGGTAPEDSTTQTSATTLTRAPRLTTSIAARRAGVSLPQVDAVSHGNILAPVGLPGLVQQPGPPSAPNLAATSQRIPNVVRYVAQMASARGPHGRSHRRSPNFIQHPWTIASHSRNDGRLVNYLDPPLEVSFALSVQYVPGESDASVVLRMRAAWDVAFGSAYVFASTVNLAAIRQTITTTNEDWRSAILAMQFSPFDPSDAASWRFPLPGPMYREQLPVVGLQNESPEIQAGRRRLLYAVVTGEIAWREHFAQWVISRSYIRFLPREMLVHNYRTL